MEEDVERVLVGCSRARCGRRGSGTGTVHGGHQLSSGHSPATDVMPLARTIKAQELDLLAGDEACSATEGQAQSLAGRTSQYR
jgi:hypothetical protein